MIDKELLRSPRQIISTLSIILSPSPIQRKASCLTSLHRHAELHILHILRISNLIHVQSKLFYIFMVIEGMALIGKISLGLSIPSLLLHLSANGKVTLTF